MARIRYTVEGYPDYRGVQLPELIGELKAYRDELKAAIDEFQSLKLEVEKDADKIDEPKELRACIDYFTGLFSGHLKDLRRLIDDIPLGVKEKHIEILRQIHESAEFEDKTGYRTFKAEYISKQLKDESTRPLMDKICQLYGDTAFDLRFLAALNARLKTFLGDSIDEKRALDKKLEMTSISGIEIPSDTRWEDIKLRFLDNEELQFFIKGKPRTVKTYISLGFADRRTDKTGLEKSKPNRLWRTLALFARKNGEISWDDTHHSESYTLVKSVSDLRKCLKAVFRINASPIGSYKKGQMTKYRTKFIISPMDDELFDRIAGWVGGKEEYRTTRDEKPDADEDEYS